MSNAAAILLVFVGTYTRGESKGIYLCQLDLSTGKLSAPELAAETASPSFLVLHPSRPFVYAVGEMGTKGAKGGAVSAFSMDPKTGKLTMLNQQPSGGMGPCHLVVDRTGRCVVVANYGSGSVASLPIRDDGTLGEPASTVQHEGSSVNEKRQKGPHAHCANLDSANRFAFIADLGMDKIMVYRLDPAKGTLAANDPPFATAAPGAGPRHLDFHPNGRYAYVINELNSTLAVYTYDAARGTLGAVQSVSALPAGFEGNNTTAEVFVHPSGKFVYGSNRGHDSIAIFAIDAATGKIRPVGHESTQGKNPRNFAIDPTGKYLLAANQDGHNIVVFSIDAETGKLRPTGSSVHVGSPVCIQMTRPR